MSLPKDINAYEDVRKALEEARKLNGAKITFDTFGQAVRFVARAYTYRKLLRQNAVMASGGLPGFSPSTAWDDLILTHDKKSESLEVKVEFGIRDTGRMSPLLDYERRPDVIPSAPAENPADELMALAERMLQEGE